MLVSEPIAAPISPELVRSSFRSRRVGGEQGNHHSTALDASSQGGTNPARHGHAALPAGMRSARDRPKRTRWRNVRAASKSVALHARLVCIRWRPRSVGSPSTGALKVSQPVRQHFHVETVTGTTIVGFVEPNLLSGDMIQEVGEQLTSLVEDQGDTNLRLNFSNVRLHVKRPAGPTGQAQQEESEDQGSVETLLLRPHPLAKTSGSASLTGCSRSLTTSSPLSTSSDSRRHSPSRGVFSRAR